MKLKVCKIFWVVVSIVLIGTLYYTSEKNDINKKSYTSEKIDINKNSIADDSSKISVFSSSYKDKEVSALEEISMKSSLEENLAKSITNKESTKSVISKQSVVKIDKYMNGEFVFPVVLNSDKKIEKLINSQIEGDIKNFYTQNHKSAVKSYFDLQSEDVKYKITADYVLENNDENFLSIKIRYYVYAGGAHGYYEDKSYNYDIKNSKEIKLKDFFKDGINYVEDINSIISSKIEEKKKEEGKNYEPYTFKTINKEQKFYLSNDSIVIYFDLYEIAPYVGGIPEFAINKNSLKSIMKPEYTQINW
ncbi:MAG: DUF3298 and DUF4163 domain-containing protein [Clostridioides sp.]|jgi:hypothetical protein|nr:DUF3298 and DUF4163 domain-containing protein [Clostridioides sp.]